MNGQQHLLLPYDPVAQKRSTGTKRSAANISDTQGTHSANASATEVSKATTKDGKASIGKTGVHLRYHMNSEYRELSMAQKRELSKWRDKDPEKKKKPCHEKRKVKARDVSAAVTKTLTDIMKSKQEMDSMDAIVSGLLKAAMSNTDTMKQKGEVAAVTNSSTKAKHLPIVLKSILKQVKNGSL